jgi:hypothetical protein
MNLKHGDRIELLAMPDDPDRVLIGGASYPRIETRMQ